MLNSDRSEDNMAVAVPIMLSSILLLAALSDLRRRKIPNRLTYPAMLIGLLLHLADRGVDGALFGLGGLFAGLGLLIVPYLLGGMGAGDVKLLAAVGAFTGAAGAFYSFLYTALAGGVYAVGVLVFRRQDGEGFFRSLYQKFMMFALTREITPGGSAPDGKRPRLCYGLAIAIGTGAYLLSGFYG
jgi:prepilin peptidase CpaA